MSKRDFILLFLLASWLFTPLSAQVRVWEEPLLLPTYRVEEPDHNPRFYEGRAYQGAQGRAYPYPMIDVKKLGGRKAAGYYLGFLIFFSLIIGMYFFFGRLKYGNLKKRR